MKLVRGFSFVEKVSLEMQKCEAKNAEDAG